MVTTDSDSFYACLHATTTIGCVVGMNFMDFMHNFQTSYIVLQTQRIANGIVTIGNF